MWIMRSKLLLSIICSLLLGNAVAQSLEQTEAIADRFMQQGEYYAAAKYYSRVFFFAPKPELHRLYAKLGDAYFGKREFDRAYAHYDNAQKLEKNDTLKSEWFLRKVSALVMQQKFKLALLEILNYRGRFTPLQKKKAEFLKATVYFGQEKFDLAKEHFKSVVPQDTLLHKSIDSLFMKKNIYRPDPKTAMWLSVVMPGLGQLYAGDVKNAVNSFLLNGTLFYLFVRDAYRFTFFESFIVFYPWIQRYYQGGFERAERIARKKQKEKRAGVYRKLYKMLL